jgi:hypothetical protein
MSGNAALPDKKREQEKKGIFGRMFGGGGRTYSSVYRITVGAIHELPALWPAL